MHSLRARLTLWLLGALLAVGGLCAAYLYVDTRNETNALLDYQMQEVARFLGAQSFDRASPQPITPNIDLDHDSEDDFVVRVRDASGRTIYATRTDVPLPDPQWLGFRSADVGDVAYRLFSARAGSYRVLVAQQMATRRETAAGAALSALLPVLLLVPVLGLLIGFAIRRGLAPLGNAAAEIAARPPFELTPLPDSGLPSELQPLIAEINRLLERLAGAVAREQRFIADAAHALRTPLTALQLQADVLDAALPDSVAYAERRARFDELHGGIRRAIRLTEHLLSASRSDSAQRSTATVSLDPLLAEAAAQRSALTASRHLHLTLQLDTAGHTVCGDARQLLLVVGNLLDNALRYSPDGGRLALNSRIDGELALIEVSDEGPGLPEAELERVFERFYRAPDDSTEGSGLGLSAVRAIVDSLGGRVSLHNRSTGSGLIARVWLPVRRETT